MTLRVEDLKPGDVVRIDLKVEDVGDKFVSLLTLGHVPSYSGDVANADLAAGNAERVQRPRPVRKGDEIVNSMGQPRRFLVAYNAIAFVLDNDSGKVLSDTYDSASVEWTHLNGDPIDWEASE